MAVDGLGRPRVAQESGEISWRSKKIMGKQVGRAVQGRRSEQKYGRGFGGGGKKRDNGQ